MCRDSDNFPLYSHCFFTPVRVEIGPIFIRREIPHLREFGNSRLVPLCLLGSMPIPFEEYIRLEASTSWLSKSPDHVGLGTIYSVVAPSCYGAYRISRIIASSVSPSCRALYANGASSPREKLRLW